MSDDMEHRAFWEDAERPFVSDGNTFAGELVRMALFGEIKPFRPHGPGSEITVTIGLTPDLSNLNEGFGD